MSTKAAVKKTVKTKTSVSEETTRQSSRGKSSTPAATPSTSNGAEGSQSTSGSSPRLSRLHEKDELVLLNDRLAAYIDKVRHLESENSRLEATVRASNDATNREVETVKTMYQREVAQTKRFLDDTSRDKAQLEIEKMTLREENAKLRDQANKDKAEMKKFEERVKGLERDLDETKKQLQLETLIRVKLENTLTSLKEELAFKEQVHEQQIRECRTVRRTEITEVDSAISEERMQAALQDMREQYEQDVEMINNEFQSKYEEQYSTLSSQLDSNARAASKAIEEMKGLRKTIDEQNKTIKDLEFERIGAIQRARDAEGDAQSIKMSFLEEITKQNSEISRLREEMTRQVEEFKALMDTKVSLDMEIATYRKLLEGEEERLHMTPGSSPRRTPRKSRTLKRRLNDYDVETSTFSSGFDVTSTSKGDIEISSIDPEGKFVTLTNKGDKDVSLGGWQIIRTAASLITTYKFHRAIKIAPLSTVTVWSSDTDQAHDPPSNLVMKGQKWVVAETMTTILKNSSGDEEASSGYGKQTSSSTFKSRKMEGFRSGPSTSLPGQGEGERCSIM